MIKYLEIPDLHFDPKWFEITEQVVKKVIEEGIKNEIDFVVFPGDMTNKTLLASEQGGINKLRYLVSLVTSRFPACAIYGTPSHEPPGSLEHLKDFGLVILKPNNTYGFYRKQKAIKPVDNKDALDLSCVLFGIPELNKKKIQAHYKVSAEEANAKTLEHFEKYIDSYVAPQRMKYNDVPAIGLLHGVVSDSHQENEGDIIKRSSGLLIHTDVLQRANLNRWSLGDIHTPWESKNISAGYAGFTGIDGNPWGKTGFEPACNMVEIDYSLAKKCTEDKFGFCVPLDITRITYGTPKRLKITQPSQAIDSKVAYWLCSKDPEAKLPENVHPWSRVTFDSERKETQRVTKEQVLNVKTLSDLFKLIDPKVSKRVLSKVDTMESVFGSVSHKKIDLKLTDLEISGCVFFDGKTVKFNLNDLNHGLTGIRGGNGDGKSSLLSFCSPYPVVVGKDTDSGRASAIKDFFNQQDSLIKKTFYLNSVKHEHLITIKAAHTKNPKVECFLIINGESILDKSSFDEMFTKCEEIYGDFQDYLLTSFYIQPGQSNKNKNLSDASITEIRNLVQSIAGVNRDNEKQHALDKVSNLKEKIKELTSWLSGVSEFQVDIESLEEELTELLNNKSEEESQVNSKQEKLKYMEDRYKEALEKKSASDSEKQKKQNDETQISNLEFSVQSKLNQIKELKKLSSSLDENIEKLNNNKIIKANKELEKKWSNEVADETRRVSQLNEDAERKYNTEKQDLENKIKTSNEIIESNNLKINSLNTPCEKCGYIPENIQGSIRLLEEENGLANNSISKYEDSLSQLTKPQPEFPKAIKRPEYQVVNEPLAELSTNKIATIEKNIEAGRDAKASIKSISDSIDQANDSITELKNNTYNINTAIYDIISNIQKNINEYKNALNILNQDLIKTLSDVKSTEDKINKSKEISSKIDEKNKEIKTLSSDLEDWVYIAKMLQPAKIPALELDMILSDIDTEATRILKPFQESRYSFETRTQDQGKSGTVDRFDIIIYDSEKGTEKSFLKHSPGYKAFLSDAYTKALIKKRNERLQRSYDPIIMDESDGPIDPDRIPVYYEIQKKYWTDNKVLIVSHNPTSHEYIDQSVNINDLKEKI